VASLLPISVFSADRETQQIMADVRMLQERTGQLQLLMVSLDETLKQISARMDTEAERTRQAFADQSVSVDSVADTVRTMRERFDDTNVRISSLSQEIEALRSAIPRQRPTYPQLFVDPETGLPMEAPAVASTPRATNDPGVSPQRMYDTAWADYTNGQWELAIQGFQTYIQNFPEAELADDAQFYIGQTHYADGQFDNAIKAFEEVLLRHPDGDIVPEASYKRGLSLDRLGQTEQARQAFERIITNHPDHSMATLAQQALDRLNQ
tara:strand:- start:422 stop:1219 length:798 start_codon:yes stop_codon:yes gene_type:complete